MGIQYTDTLREMDFDQVTDLVVKNAAGRKNLERSGVEAAFSNSAYAVCATDGGKTVGTGRALSDHRAWTLITDVAVLPEYREQGVADRLLEELIAHFKGQELFTWTKPELIPLFETHGFRRSKNSFTYTGNARIPDPGLPEKEYFLPAGYRFESEYDSYAGPFPTAQKSRIRRETIQASFSETTDGIDFSRLNEILTLAFGGRERDEAVTRETFANSRYVEFVRDGSRLIGCARAESDGIAQGFVLNVAIDPAYQRLRLGWEIVNRLADQMKGQNIFLNTHPGGVGFYNRQGFRRNKTAMLYPAHPDMPPEAAKGFMLPKGYRFADEM